MWANMGGILRDRRRVSSVDSGTTAEWLPPRTGRGADSAFVCPPLTSSNNQAANTSHVRRLRNVSRDMTAMASNDIRTAYMAVTGSSRRGKALTVVWGAVFALYTTLDDVPAAFVFGVATRAQGLVFAVLVVGVTSASLALILAQIQRKRKTRNQANVANIATEKIGRRRNDSILKDLVSTYGIGVPATVLSYSAGRVPSGGRIVSLACFYGFVGQAASYAGARGLGDRAGINPDAALGVAICSAMLYRYAIAAKEQRERFRRALFYLERWP
jgi:hypothetical protein